MSAAARFVARADLTQMLRQREALLWVFVMPIVFFYFIGTVTGGFGPRGGTSARPDVLLLDAPADGGPVLDELIGELEAQHFAIDREVTEEKKAKAVRVLVIPGPQRPGAPSDQGAGAPVSFSEAVAAGQRQTLTYVTRAEGSAVQYEQLRIGRAVYGVVADLAVLVTEGTPAEASTFRALGHAPRQVSLVVESAGTRRRAPSGFEQAIPGTLVMFTMLVALTSGGISLVLERRLGLLRRLAASPITRASLVAGKWAARLVLALIQIAFAMLAGTILFRMDWGASLPMVCLLMVAWAAFNASLALVLGSLARSEGQMVGFGIMSSMALGALGGCWWPIEIAPRWMQSFAMLLPTGWMMDALHRLVSFGDGAATVLPHLAALVAGTLLLTWAGTKAFRYE